MGWVALGPLAHENLLLKCAAGDLGHDQFRRQQGEEASPDPGDPREQIRRFRAANSLDQTISGIQHILATASTSSSGAGESGGERSPDTVASEAVYGSSAKSGRRRRATGRWPTCEARRSALA